MKLPFPILVSGCLLVTWVAGGQTVGVAGPASHARAHSARPRVAAQPPDKPPFFHPLLTTETLAIAVAEPILFSIYGRENIIRQRPYQVRLVKGYWHLSGTLPESTAIEGGTFYLVIEASNCRVRTIFHTK